jgi:hypothetical protein
MLIDKLRQQDPRIDLHFYEIRPLATAGGRKFLQFISM